MILYLIQTFFPGYYARVWNEEFESQMAELRQALYLEYPEFPEIVDRRVDEAIERWRK